MTGIRKSLEDAKNFLIRLTQIMSIDGGIITTIPTTIPILHFQNRPFLTLVILEQPLLKL